MSSEAASESAQPPAILLEHTDGGRIATLTLNRPDRLNALNAAMVAELDESIVEVSRDDRVRVVILGGAGRAFCAGADTAEMTGGASPGPHAPGDGGPEALRRGFVHAQGVVLGLQRMEKPVIAMVDGVAAGAGFDIVCACDIRMGSTRARFVSAFVRIGLFPGYGGTWLYPRVLGLGKAAELLFTGDFLSAEEAHRIGFLNHLVEPDDLAEKTSEMAARIAAGPPIALRLSKLMLYKGLEMDLETAMQMAAAAETITLGSRDHAEGVAALREKRTAGYEAR